jgi:hypothetical protein
MRGTEAKPGQEGHEAPLGEARLSDQRTLSAQRSGLLDCLQAEEGSEVVRHPAERDEGWGAVGARALRTSRCVQERR